MIKKSLLSTINHQLLTVLLLLALCSSLIALMNGCATVPRGDYVFPPPPDRPRLEYLYDLTNEKDLYPERKMPEAKRVWKFLTGTSPEDFVLLQPAYVCADEDRVYVTDTAKKCLVVFDFWTRKVSFWGTGGGGGLSNPTGVAVDKEGRVYVADAMQLVIKVFDRNGNFLYQFGKGGLGAGQFSGPHGIDIDKERGLLYVLNRGNDRIIVFDLQGNFLFDIGHPGDKEGEFVWASYIALRKEKIYVSDTFLRRFQVFDRKGKFLMSAGAPGDAVGYFARPKGIAADSDGNIYVADSDYGIVQVFNPEGKVNFVWHGVPPIEFSFPQGLYIDEKDKLYVVDTMNQRVQVYQYLK